MRFDILELKEIPRERDKLKATIGEARYHARRRRMMRVASYVMIAIATCLLAFSACATPAASPPPAVYLPLTLR